MALIFDLGFGYAGGGGGSANITSLDVTPTTSAQTITASGGVDGYSPVNVSAVTSAIDPNITASNIVNGVEILGVTGTAEKSDAVARYNVVNGVAEQSNRNLTGAFDMITSMGVNAFNWAFAYATTTGSTLFPNCVSFSDNAMSFAFYKSPINGVVGINNCTYAGENSFRYSYYNTGITSVNASSLTNAATNAFANAFEYCSNLTFVNFANMTNITSWPFSVNTFINAFAMCGLQEYDFSNLTMIRNTSDFFTSAFAYTNVKNTNFPKLSEIGPNTFRYAFRGSNIKSVYFPNIVGPNIGVNAFLWSFYSCKQLTDVNFCNLVNFNGNAVFSSAFAFCNQLTNVNFEKLTTATQNSFKNAFDSCTSLTTISFDKVTSANISAYEAAFANCYNLQTVDFSNLAYLFANSLQNAFRNCSNLTSISFPNLSSISGTTAFVNAFINCNSLTEIHFPSDTNVQSQIQSQTGYATKWGATNATIYFDL